MKQGLILWMMSFLLITCASENLNGTWSFNSWKGYLPKPKIEKMTDGTLHISGVTAKYGVGLKSGKRIPVKAGDLVRMTVLAKGKGKIFFQLQNFDAQEKWTGVAYHTVRAELTPDWKEFTLSLRAENCGDKVTAFCIATTGIGKGDELYLKNAEIEVETSEYAGDYSFPRHWSVFAPVPADLQAPVERIPAKLGEVSPKAMMLNQNSLMLASFFKEPKLRNTAWLYAELDAPVAGEYTIGAGADYFMAFYVNGKCVIDTLKAGDNSDDPHFSNHQAKISLKKGKNIFAIKFQSGSSKHPSISLGGAEDLRNLSSAVTVEKTYQRDDYEKEQSRSGNPKLIKGILTPGIESLTGQAVYQKGSIIAFADQESDMPSRVNGKLFATGIRLYQFLGDGEMIMHLGSQMSLHASRRNSGTELSLTVKLNGKEVKKMSVPVAALPCDVILAADGSEFYVNAMSLHDSKMRSMCGKAGFTVSAKIRSFIEIKTDSVTVDEYFTGIAKRETKSNTVPFKIDLAPAFDPVKAGWKLAWQDEFNGKEVDWEKTWMNSPWSPTPQNRDLAYLKDGLLHIKAVFAPDPKKNNEVRGRTVSMYSQKRFSYGYYEARVRFTKMPGWWAAFWMLDEGRNMSVAGGYEIDIFEDYSNREDHKTIADNLHVNFGPGQRSYGYHFQLPGSIDDFYVIGCKWTPFEVSVYLNGKLIRSSSRHSPYQSVTYDAFNHGFCTSTLYISVSGQVHRNGKNLKCGEEEYLVDYVRAYEYPHEQDPSIRLVRKPARSECKTGDVLTFEVETQPSAVTKAPVKDLYLFDNGNLIMHKSGSKAVFTVKMTPENYADTIWASAGRSNAKITWDSYPHLFVAAAQDANGKVVSTAVFPVIADPAASKPYQGVLPTVPGTIETNRFDEGGNRVATYKQKRGGGTFQLGQEGLFSRKKLNLREGAEWANFSFKAVEKGNYTISLKRDEYRMYYPLRALVLIDGIYVGDFVAKEHEPAAVLKNVSLSAGEHRLTLISACAYGVWSLAMEFTR